MGLLAYCYCYGEVDRLVYGLDRCANICGKQNFREPGINLQQFRCKGMDMRDKPFFLPVEEECVESCNVSSTATLYLNRCYKYSTSVNIKSSLEDVEFCKLEVFSLIGLTIMLCCVLTFIYMQWPLPYTLTTILLVTAAICLWYFRFFTYLSLSIIAAMFLYIIAIICLFVKYRHSLKSCEEIDCIIKTHPFLQLQPFLFILLMALTYVAFNYWALLIESAGAIVEIENSHYIYERDGTMVAARYLNLLGFIWTIRILTDCERLMLSATVVIYHHEPENSKMGFPIKYSYYNLIRYHLGSTIFGSILDPTNAISYHLLRALQYWKLLDRLKENHSSLKWIAAPRLIRYAYIRIGESGRAIRRCLENYDGFESEEFNLVLVKVMIAMPSIVVGFVVVWEKCQHPFMLPVIIIGIGSYLVADAFAIIYEVVLDATVICKATNKDSFERNLDVIENSFVC
ncbi:PREDICTED: choline transporter-like protein 3 [Nicrophorus vespilloides]|uniref:Choline transporter-like protein n=1 Tax=Nicrophorus vespilloides TaxID=110193 RepID=A0ABM1MWG3_NICVS|nr:PREDICTED: choline transporter-like protein 3 [Nicrophorus vespilloides]